MDSDTAVKLHEGHSKAGGEGDFTSGVLENNGIRVRGMLMRKYNNRRRNGEDEKNGPLIVHATNTDRKGRDGGPRYLIFVEVVFYRRKTSLIGSG